MTIIRENLEWYQEAVIKHTEDEIEEYNKELADLHESQWAILMDKGYQRLAREIKAVAPKKERSGFLTNHDR